VDIVDPRIEEYVERMSSPHEPLLAELSEETSRELGMEEMLTGPVAGRLLELLVWLGKPKRVLEIGTFSGHSALAMAGGLPDDGRIDTLEVDPKRAELARRYFDRSPYRDRITLHLGPALETIDRLEGEFDFVFIDADKGGYIDYYEAVLPRLSERGVIAVDNTLSSGRVTDPADDGPITQFNEHVHDDPRAASVILSVRDGITLIRRR
jgi:predicted O-methyltransferase YrrM